MAVHEEQIEVDVESEAFKEGLKEGIKLRIIYEEDTEKPQSSSS